MLFTSCTDTFIKAGIFKVLNRKECDRQLDEFYALFKQKIIDDLKKGIKQSYHHNKCKRYPWTVREPVIDQIVLELKAAGYLVKEFNDYISIDLE